MTSVLTTRQHISTRIEAPQPAGHVVLVSAFLLLVVIVATPRTLWWAFIFYAGIVGWFLDSRHVRWWVAARYLRWEIPFVAFAILTPFIATGPTTDIGPLTLSIPGLWASFNLLAKATLGVLIAAGLAASLSSAQLVTALRRLRLPSLLVQITAFTIRYVDVVHQEYRRMVRAQLARGANTRSWRTWKVRAQGLAALFIRCFERGERIHIAMQARGYTGDVSPWEEPTGHSTLRSWLLACRFAIAASVVMGMSIVFAGGL